MKELITLGQKAKAYDEAIDKIADVVDAGTIEQGLAEWLFPELKESEDEKIRRALIRTFKSLNTIRVWSGIERTDILAWLEKQGEQKLKMEEQQ